MQFTHEKMKARGDKAPLFVFIAVIITLCLSREQMEGCESGM